jgi:hypothetical protein
MEGIRGARQRLPNATKQETGPSKGEIMFKGRNVAKWTVALVGLLMPALAHASGSTATTITITATVDAFAEWASATGTIAASDFTGHITAANQSVTATLANTLYSNVTTTITPTAGASSGVLTSGSQTLTTAYELTGVDTPDSSYKAADATSGDFFAVANTYTLTHVSGTGTYTVNLLAKASSGAVAPDSGNYSCGVVLTAAW